MYQCHDCGATIYDDDDPRAEADERDRYSYDYDIGYPEPQIVKLCWSCAFDRTEF